MLQKAYVLKFVKPVSMSLFSFEHKIVNYLNPNLKIFE